MLETVSDCSSKEHALRLEAILTDHIFTQTYGSCFIELPNKFWRWFYQFVNWTMRYKFCYQFVPSLC